MEPRMCITKIFIFIGFIMFAHSDKNVPDYIMNRWKGNLDLSKLITSFGLDQRFRNFESTGIALQNEPCAPQPAVVAVPQPKSVNTFYYPYYVRVHRCAGGCGPLQFVSQCRPTETKIVRTKVISVTWSSGHPEDAVPPSLAYVELRNDTSCECNCKHNGEVCNRFQYWDSQSCKCQCLSWGCPRNYESHPDTCCACHIRDQVCVGRKRVWSPEKCACLCKNIHKPCMAQGKIRNPLTCKCTCLPLTCKEGATFNPKSCTCDVQSNT